MNPIDHPAVQAAIHEFFEDHFSDRTALSRAGLCRILSIHIAPALEQLVAEETKRCAEIALKCAQECAVKSDAFWDVDSDEYDSEMGDVFEERASEAYYIAEQIEAEDSAAIRERGTP